MSIDRDDHKALLRAEKADDATAIRVYRAIARNARSNRHLSGFPSVIEALCDRLEAAAGRLAEAERERDRLIEGCVMECWRRRPTTLASRDNDSGEEHGWEWRYGAMGDFVATRAEAIASVRKAAGLDAPEDPR
jgi:hypothetical protein